jgi:1,4-alpha-glucan branching enzyme
VTVTERAARAPGGRVVHDASLLRDDDLHYFNEGSHGRLYRVLGAHPGEVRGERGVHFAVWAPNARAVSVVGSFNGWDREAHPLATPGSAGIWTGFIPGVTPGAVYKYHVVSRFADYRVDKADPFGFHHELAPATASIVWELDYEWADDAWMAARRARIAPGAPVSVYEVHAGSWRRPGDPGRRFLSYRELAHALAEHVTAAGFTHVELMPITEHPFYGSWGYQPTGYFAPTSRYGTPQDLMYLVDHLHQAGIGVLLDWVPSHFPADAHGLGFFDGTHLYEHADPREGYHPDWNSFIFNYGRHEVRSFLLSGALFWLDHYHIDGLRVDAVASMLYRDYSRRHGEWIPNVFGGRENLEAIAFLRRFNEVVYAEYPDVQTIAEESTAWPGVSRPTYIGGLGFGMKWDMGWMHDTLEYLAREPVHCSFHHHDITFRMIYAFNESFMLPLSHDEVVHGKGALVAKSPGDAWQQRASLRLLFGYMFAQPGKKLLFMGGEIGQWSEWSHEGEVEWHLLQHAEHQGILRWVTDLNRLYASEPALHELDFQPHGFEWVEGNDGAQSVLAFLRKDARGEEVLAVFNFTPVPRENYRVGVPRDGRWRELLNSDAAEYGGGGLGNMGGVDATPVPYHGRFHSVVLTLPPLSAVFLRAPAPPDSAEALEREAETEPEAPSPAAERKTRGPGQRRPGSAPAPDYIENAWSEGGPERVD